MLSRPARMLGAVAGVLALGSAAWQVAGDARDRRRYPPPGRLVNVGGHRLHIRCAGAGSPTVVIIPALGAYSAAWLEVQDALACSLTCLADARRFADLVTSVPGVSQCVSTAFA